MFFHKKLTRTWWWWRRCRCGHTRGTSQSGPRVVLRGSHQVPKNIILEYQFIIIIFYMYELHVECMEFIAKHCSYIYYVCSIFVKYKQISRNVLVNTITYFTIIMKMENKQSFLGTYKSIISNCLMHSRNSLIRISLNKIKNIRIQKIAESIWSTINITSSGDITKIIINVHCSNKINNTKEMLIQKHYLRRHILWEGQN